tara:strand:+ start:10365 stop:11339 length:975 start_codon:yes stop_codon:yes gene_type:complete
MGVNFPTAFWKNQPSQRADDSGPPIITWNLNLYYGEGDYNNFEDVQTDSNFPFKVGGNDFNTDYNYLAATADDPNSPAYFGWYLDGDLEYPNDVHRADPWIVEEDGRKIDLLMEADYRTLYDLHDYYSFDDFPVTAREVYNPFIQSGRAVGTFTLNSTSTLTIKVSGLGERATQTARDYEFDQMKLYVNSNVVCSGVAPANTPVTQFAGGGWGADNDLLAWDMDQCKFFNSAGNQSPNPNPPRNNLGTTLYDYDGDAVVYYQNGTGTLNNVVNQDNRRKYTTVGGQFSTNLNLSAGTHTIDIFFNTNDGLYASGAFYGATFSFS